MSFSPFIFPENLIVPSLPSEKSKTSLLKVGFCSIILAFFPRLFNIACCNK
jgi:hypothetical protein